MTALPPLTVEEMIEQVIDDSSSDYNDSDNPGYYRNAFDPETGILTMTYEPDTDPELDEQYRATKRETTVRFQLLDVN